MKDYAIYTKRASGSFSPVGYVRAKSGKEATKKFATERKKKGTFYAIDQKKLRNFQLTQYRRDRKGTEGYHVHI